MTTFERVLVELEPDPNSTAAALVGRDDELLEEVGSRAAPPTARLWVDRPAVVAPHRLLRAVERLELVDGSGRPWPVCGRSSGGGVVVHEAGTLNLSLVLPSRTLGDPSIEEAYALWLEVLGSTLRDSYGVAIAATEIRDAFCNGRWDAAVGPRKLAGTAQTRRKGAVVVHGTILVDVNRAAYVALVAHAEAAFGVPNRPAVYDPSSIATVAELIEAPVTARRLAASLAARVHEPRGRDCSRGTAASR